MPTEIRVALLDFAILHPLSEIQVLLLSIFFRSILIEGGDYSKLAIAMGGSSDFSEELSQLSNLNNLYSIVMTVIGLARKHNIPLEESLLAPILALAQIDGICRHYHFDLLPILKVKLGIWVKFDINCKLTFKFLCVKSCVSLNKF